MTLTELDCPTHEHLYRVTDPATGLLAFIALHSTARGPAAGGTRFKPYGQEEDAIADVLNLSRGMTYKNAAADLPLGGGKAVIVGDPARVKSPELLRAFGRAVAALGGRYWTAEDMGMSPRDIEVLAEVTDFVGGRTGGEWGSGDPGPATAEGVLRGLRVALKHATGSDGLGGRVVAIQGLGNVGRALAARVAALGGRLIVADTDPARVAEAERRWNAQRLAPDAIHRAPAEVFAPCAVGAVLNGRSIPQIRARVVAGSANNQLATPDDGARLARRGILYAPDYIINCGGVISVSAEILRIRDRDRWLADKLGAMTALLGRVFDRSARSGEPPDRVADRLVERRLLPAAA